MTDLTKDELIDLRISSIINDAEERIFQRFDELHKRGINDDDVIRYLRKQGYTDYAEQYIEWAEAVDPDAEGGDETDTVPDPASAESYKNHPLNQRAPGGMIAALEKHLDSWESQGHTTVGIAFLRRHFGISK
ncbi:hypothetical protein SEA_BRUHMOMENT_60 [Arthrobacter phage BruhMoment]|nr:hypothetical protein SEA_BRUHMOMENT_60 [Arthrobacter phage BruhMoment]